MLGPVPISDKTFRKISWSLESARSGVKKFAALLNWTGTSVALLPRRLSNFRAMVYKSKYKSLRDLTIGRFFGYWNGTLVASETHSQGRLWHHWALFRLPKISQRTHDAIITSLWRRNDVATSFWRHSDVIIASCACWDCGVVRTWRNKQRVLMHRHQGWNVRHGLCHIYMRYLYIYELFIAFVCFVVCSLL